MSDQDIALIASALSGGLLTVVGGYLATFFIQRSAKKSEWQKRIFDKIEEMYTLSDGIGMLLRTRAWEISQSVVDNNANASLPSAEMRKEIRRIVERMRMLASLYAPTLLLSVKKFDRQVMDLCDEIEADNDMKLPINDKIIALQDEIKTEIENVAKRISM